jgi:hypothetical protein
MITHNGTYLGAATHHGMPIYAATMGGKMVIGGWLLSATKQAIVAAFGAEGTEVIRKTNDYLNRIATTDPARALLLAGFINEDPLLVCSLVETSKTRWLVGDGKAYIETGWTPNGAQPFEITYESILSKDPSNRQLEGWSSAGSCWWGINANRTVFGSTGNGQNFEDGSHNEIKITYSGSGNTPIYLNGASAGTSTFVKGAEFRAFNINGLAGSCMRDKRKTLRIVENNMLVKDFLPFIRNGENGMLDIISGTFHPNANTEGSFTIQITDTTPA